MYAHIVRISGRQKGCLCVFSITNQRNSFLFLGRVEKEDEVKKNQKNA